MSKEYITDKKNPDIELKGEEAKNALTNNPFIPISKAINDHANNINQIRNVLESTQLDIKAGKANMEIFDKRFKLVERQLDNIERELNNIKKELK